MNKILTIIVPSYNMENYLPTCLGSMVVKKEDGTVDEKLLSSLEVLVINDGSKDRTSEIGHEFEKQYPGVFRCIDKSNGHYGSCVNRGLKEATGFYVKVVDADDYVDTKYFRDFLTIVQEEFVKGDKAVDLLVTNYREVDNDGNVLKYVDHSQKDNNEFTFPEDCGLVGRFQTHCIAYKLENIKKCEYKQTEGQMYTDTEWIIEPMVLVKSMRFFPFPVVCYLIGRQGQSVEQATLFKNFQQILNVVQNLIMRFDLYEKYSNTKSFMYYRECIFQMIKWVYLCGLVGEMGNYPQGDFIAFDKVVQQNQYFYQSSNELNIPFNRFPIRYFPFYYVKEWRRAKYKKNFVFSFYGLYLKLRAKHK